MSGRGGRGLALLKAIEDLEKEKGPGNQGNGTPPAPIGPGRGRSISQLLVTQPTVPAVPSGSGNGRASLPASVGRGRSILQNIILESPRAPEPPSPSTCAVTQAVQDIQIVGGPPPKLKREVSPEDCLPVIRKGTMGKKFVGTANYIVLNGDPAKGVFEYEVRFNPEQDSINIRYKLLNSVRDHLGGVKTFDGRVLYLPIKLDEEVTILNTPHPVNQSNTEIKIIYKKKKRLGECIHMYNVLFNRIFKVLNYTRFGRQFFNPNGTSSIPQYKLELWPGYVSAVDEFEGGLMLTMNASHRVLRTQTCLDIIEQFANNDPQNYKDAIKKVLLGAVVLTRYNNKTYRVDDIDFGESPRSSFEGRNGDMTFIEYYKQQYNMDIRRKDQPLIVHREKARVGPKPGEKEQQKVICLIPEFCYMTGITDEMRADFKIMKEIANHTRITPNQRLAALRKYKDNVLNNPEACKIITDWGLSLAPQTISLEGRTYDKETIMFNSSEVGVSPKADWRAALGQNGILDAVDLTSWILIHTRNDTSMAKKFADMLRQTGGKIGMAVAEPKYVPIPTDRNDAYLRALRENITKGVQVVVTMCPTSRDDRYSIIKKVVCAETPIASQVVLTKTLNKLNSFRSVCQNIALQINCKLGGALWAVKIPFADVMICGVDSYHDPTRKGSSVGGFVASINPTFTRWYSKVSIQDPGQELLDGLKINMVGALKKYYSVNNKFPDRIIIYRDGVGDGQLKPCAEWEVPQLISTFKTVSPDYNPKLSVVVVQKRINTRIFASMRNGYENPPPGSVIDHTITRRDWYDFFLVSQFANEGTVTPTHYVVVYDGCQLKIDYMQRLTYKLTHLYYNWPGTIRVPAPCQYAHKLAYLIGENVKKMPSSTLEDKLYYL